MRTRRTRSLFAAVLTACAYACGNAPTFVTLDAVSPRMGHTVGSGNVVPADSANETAVVSDVEGTAVDSSSVERGGHTLGSGH